jgi:hypothetical protein
LDICQHVHPGRPFVVHLLLLLVMWHDALLRNSEPKVLRKVLRQPAKVH